jgi:hypothetical protein
MPAIARDVMTGEMRGHRSKLTAKQREAQHARYERDMAYVAEHRDRLLRECAEEGGYELQAMVQAIGNYSIANAQSFDEALLLWWRGYQ